MLKRKITEELIKWKENQLVKKKALLIKGLRQIGKTYIIRDFARKYYKYEVYIDFKRNSELKTIFDGDFSVDRILMDLSAKIVGLKFVPHETVIIFDEIQECANARTALKYFVNDGRYDVIASGSLLGIRGYNKKKSRGVPTGSEHIIYMHPLDFEEFLWAKGVSEEVIYYLKECFESRKPISKVTHESLLRYFKEYICVGGLPEAVKIFLKTGNLNLVYQEQRDILEEYKDDFGKHLNEEENEEVDEK